MTQELVVDLIRQAVMTVITVGAGPISMGLAIGLTVSIFQAVTSIQEPTLAFAPKILAVMLSLTFFGYFMITTLMEFVLNLYHSIPVIINQMR